MQHASPNSPAADLLSAVLALVRERTGTDFHRYRRTTVERRVQNRMRHLGAQTLDDYLRLLEQQPDETDHLIERLTIKVSRFYRNRAAFDFLRTEFLPAIARERPARPLRVWSAGCGNGEEAYSLAMVLDEAGLPHEVEATDLDPRALACMGHGVYPLAAAEELPEELKARYLEQGTERQREVVRVREPLRSSIRAARHDLTQSWASERAAGFDLIACRNVLIYLDERAQDQVLTQLVSALVPGGILCLGEAEWPTASVAPALVTLHHKGRLFRAVCSAERSLRGALR